MKILLTGSNGQLGFALRRALAPLGEVVALDRAACDLADADALRRCVRAVQPAVIVNPAAYTAVDRAESDAATACAVNAVAPGVLGEEAARLGVPVVHYSTDYVFDGRQTRPYREDDAPAPLNVYGKSKLDGEAALAAATPQHLILRTSWVVGSHGGNFARTMLRLAAERERLSVVADQFGAPTSADLLADLTAQLVARMPAPGLAPQAGQAAQFPYGLYHVAAAGETSWYDYARFVIGQAQARGLPLRAGPDDVLPITTAEYPTPARRPASSRLDCGRFTSTFGLCLPPWQAGMSHLLEQIL